MKVISTVKRLQNRINKLKLNPVGLVPTMGALHKGHLSLVRNAITECQLVVISIYVNPTQFNDPGDLHNYPRSPGEDLRLLREILRENDLVFTPDDKELYPEEDTQIFDFGNLDKIMEGLHRPGHFNGVAQVVSRLFEIIRPDIAYFGLKDFQQLAVIKKLVSQTGNKVRITGNPIIREEDGLAMSSRNWLLEPAIRKNAGIIYSTISAASKMISGYEINQIKEFVIKTINQYPGFNVEYFDIVDDTDLLPVSTRDEMKKGKRYFGCIAVKAGRIRLIDNIEIPLL